MSKTKVLMVSCEGLGRGGVQAVMMSIIRNLRDEIDFDMLLFTNEKRYYDDEFLSYSGKIIRVPFYNGKNKLRKRLDYYVRGLGLYRKILNAVRENGPYHAIHCNNAFESAICVAAALRVNVPIRIVHSHTSPAKPNVVASALNWIYRKIINRYANVRLGCSREACDSLFGENGGVVVNNPYDENRFDLNKYPVLSQKSSLEFVQVGRFDENKNQLFSLEVLRTLLMLGNRAQLHLVGFGESICVEALKKYVEINNLSANVIFHASDANIPEIMSQCDAFLLPSKREGFGIVLIEAQAMGLKCFVSDSVPKTTNVGGCVYLPLDSGTESWAKCILSTDLTKNKFDCSGFCTRKFIQTFAEIYGG